MTTATKEKPILFSGPMVRAILNGSKTQTRRIANETLFRDEYPDLKATAIDAALEISPFQVGMHLWVREKFWWHPVVGTRGLREGADTWPTVGGEFIAYDADGDGDQWRELGWRKRPSIHMPRAASRITLEVTGVRVERIQDIGKDGRKARDVLAEGVSPSHIDQQREWFHPDDAPAIAFAHLWESVNGKGAWARNDWVWVIEFKRVDA